MLLGGEPRIVHLGLHQVEEQIATASCRRRAGRNAGGPQIFSIQHGQLERGGRSGCGTERTICGNVGEDLLSPEGGLRRSHHRGVGQTEEQMEEALLLLIVLIFIYGFDCIIYVCNRDFIVWSGG